MREMKRTVPMYSFYDRTGIQNYLEEQAEKGWMLEKAGTICWRFRRTEPRKLKFSVVYFPEADLYDSAPGEGEQTFREYCEHAGWHFAASQAQMLIFYSISENPVPIDTDPVIEVENIHKSMKKSILPSYWCLMVCAVLQLILQCMNITNDIVGYLSNNINLYLIVFWPSMLLLCTGRLIFYGRWHRRAKRAAEEGEFLESRGFQRIEAAWAVLAIAGLAACLLFGRSLITAFGVIFGTVVGLGIVAVEYITREALKKKGYDAAKNKVKTIVVTLAACFLLIVIGTPLAFHMLDNTTDWHEDDLYIELSDLMDAEYKTLELEDAESVLLGWQRIMHYTSQKGPIKELQYQVIRVKAGFLYDLCREKILRDDAFELEAYDCTAWRAKDAYAVYRREELEGYLLCYEDYIVCIWPNWEMTAEQMAVIGGIFE